MKILYGAAGEGMGHGMRVGVVGAHLEEQGHTVVVASSGGALAYLKKRFPGRALPLVGLGSVIVGNTVSPVETAIANAIEQVKALPYHAAAFVATATAIRPDVVITDFEPQVARWALFTSRPLIAIDNIHQATRCRHPSEITDQADAEHARKLKMVTRFMVPAATEFLVTVFAKTPVKHQPTTLHLPILRQAILSAKAGARVGNYVVTYFNDKADHRVLRELLLGLGVPVHAYGRPRQMVAEKDGAIEWRPFSEEEFIADLAGARAVISGAGFTLASECVFLGKPLLAVPFGGQFEQILNAYYLERLGYGERCDVLSAPRLRRFLDRAPAYAENLRGFVHDQNRALFAHVDQLLAQVEAAA